MSKLRKFIRSVAHLPTEENRHDALQKAISQLRRKQKREAAMKKLDAMRADLNGSEDKWFLCSEEKSKNSSKECNGGSF